MTIVGRYRPVNPADAYWGPRLDGTERLSDVGVFTPPATFALLGSNVIGLDVALTVPAEAYRGTDPVAMAQRVADRSLRLTADGVTVTSGLAGAAERFREEQRLVVIGVVIGVGELLVVTWLALFLAIRRTADARRGDIALLKVRGIRRWDLSRLVAALILVPLVLGGAIGIAAGPWLAGRLATDRAQPARTGRRPSRPPASPFLARRWPRSRPSADRWARPRERCTTGRWRPAPDAGRCWRTPRWCCWRWPASTRPQSGARPR